MDISSAFIAEDYALVSLSNLFLGSVASMLLLPAAAVGGLTAG